MVGHGLPVPRLIAMDATGESARVWCTLVTALPGSPLLAPIDLDDWLRQLAQAQAQIHALPPTLSARTEGAFDPALDFGWIPDPSLRRDALAAAMSAPADGQPVFAHGDYQHFNVLWTANQLSGVVDWTSTGTGSRGLDVGHCRLNLAVLFSADAADAYARYYERASAVPVDPRADLQALLAWNPSWLEFIPAQVAGRTRLQLESMPDRVVETIRRTVARLS